MEIQLHPGRTKIICLFKMDLEFEVSFGVKVSFEVSFVSTFNFNGEFIGDNNNNSSTPINRPLTPNTPTILQIKQNQTNSKNKKLTSKLTPKLTSNSRSVEFSPRTAFQSWIVSPPL